MIVFSLRVAILQIKNLVHYLRKQSESLSDEEKIPKLERALEDITAACILEGFSRKDHLLLVDSIIKDVGNGKFNLSKCTNIV